jgi:DNA replication protein DnaC
MNKQQIIDSISEQFGEKRARAQAVAYSNLLKARANPEFSDAEKRARAILFNLGKAQAYGKPTKALEQELMAAKAEMALALTRLGLKKEDIEPNYECKKCNDTGKIGSKTCDCFARALKQKMIESSGAKSNLADFSQFDETLITDPKQLDALKKIRVKFERYVDAYPNTTTHTFLFCGKTGVGKTFITECIARAMINKGYLVSFISAFGMNNNFLKYHTTFDENKQSYYDCLLEPELLVIDDLGTEPILKNITINYLCSLLNDRFEAKKITLITTNLDLDGIMARYGNRIFSRIVNKADSELFKIDGDDLRLKRR